MIYTKPHLSFEKQADLLLQRGLVCDRAHLIEHLSTVGYYRLSGYWYPFRRNDPSNRHAKLSDFLPGTTFDEVWNRYLLDRQLRLLVMDAIERFEVYLRSQLAYHHASSHGPFAYATHPTTLPGLLPQQHARFRFELQDQQERSEDAFVRHFWSTYGSHHDDLPIWMASELFSFGALFTFYRGCEPAIQQKAAAGLGIHDTVLYSWLLTFNVIRNTCAHHGRLWNRELSVKPKIPNRDLRWHSPVLVENNRVFGILTICRYCLGRVAPRSLWANRLRRLLTDFPRVPTTEMGFPVNWEKCPIWQ